MRGAELLARVDAAVLAPQPLAVHEHARGRAPRGRGCGRAARSPRGRAPRRRPLAEQRARAGVDPSAQSVPLASAISASRSSGPAARSACRCGRRPRRGRQQHHTACRAVRSSAARSAAASGLVVAAEAVVEHRVPQSVAASQRPFPRGASPAGASISARPRPPGRASPPARSPRRPRWLPVASTTASASAMQRRGRREPAAEEVGVNRSSSATGSRRARRPGGPARPGAREVSSQPRRRPGPGRCGSQPEPAQLLLLGERLLPERAQRTLQRRRPGGVALGQVSRASPSSSRSHARRPQERPPVGGDTAAATSRASPPRARRSARAPRRTPRGTSRARASRPAAPAAWPPRAAAAERRGRASRRT